MDGGDGFGIVALPVGPAHAHAAKAECGDRQPLGAQCAFLHEFAPLKSRTMIEHNARCSGSLLPLAKSRLGEGAFVGRLGRPLGERLAAALLARPPGFRAGGPSPLGASARGAPASLPPRHMWDRPGPSSCGPSARVMVTDFSPPPARATLAMNSCRQLRRDLETALILMDADGADMALGDAAGAADQRQQPARFGILLAPDIQLEPLAAGEIATGGLGVIRRRARFRRIPRARAARPGSGADRPPRSPPACAAPAIRRRRRAPPR